MDCLRHLTHFYHDFIIKCTNRDKTSLPKFIKYWRDNIKQDDIVFHLGDIYMGKGSDAKAKLFLPTLPGQKYFLRGNHDSKSKAWFSDLGWTEVGERSRFRFDWDAKSVLISHYPDCIDLDWDINIHGHIHNGGYAPGTPALDYRNVSLEAVWRPVRLREVLEEDAYQSRSETVIWPLSKIYEMRSRDKIDSTFCEIESYH